MLLPYSKLRTECTITGKVKALYAVKKTSWFERSSGLRANLTLTNHTVQLNLAGFVNDSPEQQIKCTNPATGSEEKAKLCKNRGDNALQ